jgi:hypothetical protein
MADLLSYALTDVASVKETLGIDNGDTSKDNLIKRKINQATLYIETFCGLPADHHFKATTYTQEEYDGTGVDQLSLKMRPVTTLSSFQYRGTVTNENDWQDVDAELYFTDLNAGVIDLLFSQTRHWNRYRVTYTAGYTTIPADLAEACVTLASFWVDNSTSGTNVKRKREGGREIEYFALDSQQSGKSLMEALGLDDILARYINYSVQDDK